MKPEPLKNKELDDLGCHPHKGMLLFEKEDIKSAVEWLLMEFDCRYEHGASKEQLIEAINMAFEDVIK